MHNCHIITYIGGLTPPRDVIFGTDLQRAGITHPSSRYHTAKNLRYKIKNEFMYVDGVLSAKRMSHVSGNSYFHKLRKSEICDFENKNASQQG